MPKSIVDDTGVEIEPLKSNKVNKVGKPPKFSKEICEQLVDLMYQGLTDAQIIRKWRIAEKTFRKWLQSHPQFKSAYQRGIPGREAFWEQLGIDAMLGKKNLNFKYYELLMKKVYKFSEAGEAQRGGTQIINNIQNMNVLEMSPEEVNKKLSQIMEKHRVTNLEELKLKVIKDE